MDAPSGLIRLIGRKAGRRANSQGSDKPAKNKSVRSWGRPAGVGLGEQPQTSTLGNSYGLKRATLVLKIPRLCKAGLGEVEFSPSHKKQ